MIAQLIVLLGCAIVLYAVLACSAPTPVTAAPAAPVSTTLSSATPSSTAQSSATPPASTQPSSSSSSPAQSSSATATPASAASDTPELNTRTSQVPLQSHANLVPIRVVVHDASGYAVENLHKKDFEVKQDGKLQFITHFSVETPASGQVARGEAVALPPDSTSHAITSSSTDAAASAAGGANAGGKLALPTRFVALLFDDSHLDVGDLNRAKIAALKFIDISVKPSERLAMFNISGRAQVDFTDDHEKIRDAIKRLIPTPVGAYDPKNEHDCLQITYYQADLIQNKHDQQALDAATEDALACNAQAPSVRAASAQAQGQAQATEAAALVASTVPAVLQAGGINTQYAVRRLGEVVQRVSALPGQRSVVLISPGFLTSTYEYDVSQVIDKANRSNVFINTLDARGLYTVDPVGDISQPAPVRANAATAAMSAQYRLDEQRVQSEVLSDLADSTGGFYFRNNNDLDAGFRATAAEPEVSYLLAIVPDNLKNDGKFHTLSVKLLIKEKYTVQARRGFFAPKRGQTPEEVARQDIEGALFSQEEQEGFPIELHLQYYKVDEMNGKLAVLAHVDLTKLHFEKFEGRNWDDLTIVAGLFDRNGNFITGEQKTLEMRLKDNTLERLAQTGVTVKSNFDVKPGGYMVRLVVRDSKAAQLSACNGVVEIP